MRVLMVTPFPRDPNQIVGGVAGVAAYLSRQLKDQQGIDLEILSPQNVKCVSHDLDFDGIPVKYLGTTGGFVARKWFVRRLANTIADYTNNCNCDLVHIQGATEWTRFISKPYIFTVHGIPERDFLYRSFPSLRRMLFPFVRARQQRFRRRIPHAISISPYVQENLDGSLRGQVWDIENPVRDDFFDIQSDPVPGQLLYGGVISERKNIVNLIRAIAISRNDFPDLRMKIAGFPVSQKYYDTCLRLLADLGLEDTIEFLGNLNVEQMQQQLAQASALVLCSWQETAPVIIEEAMACGVPVVASDRCGMPYMIEDGKTGALVEPGDPRSIADGINRVLQEGVAEAMSKRSREVAERRFRASTVAMQTAQVYRQILEKHNM